MRFLALLITLLLSTSCENTPTATPSSSWQEIQGRYNAAEPEAPPQKVYRVKVPTSWTRIDPSDDKATSDTKKELIEFVIEKGTESVHITIHNFPYESIKQRIPPSAQVHRWKKQFTKLDPSSISVTPQAFGGFSGLLFEGEGVLNGTHKTVLAWAMQLAPEHFLALNAPKSPDEKELYKQMQGDYTIKVVGDPMLTEIVKDEIMTFARSFETIKMIPPQ